MGRASPISQFESKKDAKKQNTYSDSSRERVLARRDLSSLQGFLPTHQAICVPNTH